MVITLVIHNQIHGLRVNSRVRIWRTIRDSPRKANEDGWGFDDSNLVTVREIVSDEVEKRGLREWPSLTRRNSFTERLDPGEEKYILEGRAQLRISQYMDGMGYTLLNFYGSIKIFLLFLM